MEYDAIRRFTYPKELDKALHTLEGILTGVMLDGEIDANEVGELQLWVAQHYDFADHHPYKELVPILLRALSDHKLDSEEVEEILWATKNMHTPNKYYDVLTSDIQRLEGMLHGILADNYVSEKELGALTQWMLENENLTGLYPYDELFALITAVEADGKVDDEERKLLTRFFSEFVDVRGQSMIDTAELKRLKEQITVSGICALDPTIEFEGRLFCATGEFDRAPRAAVAEAIVAAGATFKNNLVSDTNYLVVGNKGCPCWAFSCYGRKVEQAMQMRKEGKLVMIVNEVDLWDALQ